MSDMKRFKHCSTPISTGLQSEAQTAELDLDHLGMDNEKRKLAVAGCEEGKSLNGILDDVAWSLECLQVSEYKCTSESKQTHKYPMVVFW